MVAEGANVVRGEVLEDEGLGFGVLGVDGGW